MVDYNLKKNSLGEFVDDYTVRVIDVFAMPQTGTGVSVEAVDPVFQAKMLDMLKQTGRPEMVVGWYHSHPGFGCWLSGICEFLFLSFYLSHYSPFNVGTYVHECLYI